MLLLLANFGKEGTPQTVIPKMSQETLAGIIGTARSRVSFFMNRFRKLGFVEYNGDLKVHSSLLNVVLHDRMKPSANNIRHQRSPRRRWRRTQKLSDFRQLTLNIGLVSYKDPVQRIAAISRVLENLSHIPGVQYAARQHGASSGYTPTGDAIRRRRHTLGRAPTLLI